MDEWIEKTDSVNEVCLEWPRRIQKKVYIFFNCLCNHYYIILHSPLPEGFYWLRPTSSCPCIIIFICFITSTWCWNGDKVTDTFSSLCVSGTPVNMCFAQSRACLAQVSLPGTKTLMATRRSRTPGNTRFVQNSLNTQCFNKFVSNINQISQFPTILTTAARKKSSY